MSTKRTEQWSWCLLRGGGVATHGVNVCACIFACVGRGQRVVSLFICICLCLSVSIRGWVRSCQQRRGWDGWGGRCVCVHAALLVSRAQWHASHCMYWGGKVTSEYLPAACIKSHRCASLHQKNQQARVEIWRKTSSLHCASFYMKDVNLKVQKGEMNNKKTQNKKIIIEKPVLTWHLFRHLLFFILPTNNYCVAITEAD